MSNMTVEQKLYANNSILRAANEELKKHEQQTHETLGEILGTDTSLEDGAKRLKAENERLLRYERAWNGLQKQVNEIDDQFIHTTEFLGIIEKVEKDCGIEEKT